MKRSLVFVLGLVLLVIASGCAKKPVATPTPAPAPPPTAAAPPVRTAPPAPPTRVEESLPVPTQPLSEDNIANRSLEDLNRDSPLKPAFFLLDSADLDDTGRAIVTTNAAVLKKYPSWQITIEGHCDERGSAEYNLGLGDRRTEAANTYLEAIGVPAGRLKTVSFGKEKPQCTESTAACWQSNRRVHFSAGEPSATTN